MNNTTSSKKPVARKATHKGTCQICGSIQMLPEGRLAKHGYTVKWGFFSGVCPGSHGLPFEQSTDLIEAHSNAVANQIRANDREIAGYEDINAPANDGSSVWVQIYAAYSYQWVKAKLVEFSIKDYGTFKSASCSYLLLNRAYGDRDERHVKPTKIEAYSESMNLMTIRDWARYQNRKYALACLGKANADRAQWLAWQQERVAKWAPAPLIPR